MPPQSTTPHIQGEKNWPRRILWIVAGIILVLVLGLLIYAGVKGGGVQYEENEQQEGIAVGEPNPNGYDCSGDYYNCANFTTQSEAQVAFDSCFKDKGDVWNLDSDGDGKVCEGLAG